MRSAGPVQPGEDLTHGQTPASCGMTRRAGSPRGILTDRRSSLLGVKVGVAQHPVARLGLPAPCTLRVSCGPSGGQCRWQSLQGHGSRFERSSCARRRVKHGLPTAAVGRFVASADRPPPWTTLRCATPTSSNTGKVVQ
jgi:hypothetical protein